MRFVTYVAASGGAQRAGLLLDEDRSILDLQRAWEMLHPGEAAPEAMRSVLGLVEGGDAALDTARELLDARARLAGASVPRSVVTLRAPIPRPPQMRDFLCFEKHLLQAYTSLRRLRAERTSDPQAAMAEMDAKGILQMPQAWYERPYFYHPNRLNVIGHEEDVRWPWYCEQMDFELELGLVIGKPTLEVSRERALDHVFGYTIFNDVSARDEQSRESPGTLGPGKGKDFDTGNILGPCLVTADEVGDPYALTMIARVNGEEWARGSTRDMHWKWEDCIAHVARAETLVPGEVLGSGTVGDGCGLEHMRFLNPGDVVELEIERIGVLRNRFVRQPRPLQDAA